MESTLLRKIVWVCFYSSNISEHFRSDNQNLKYYRHRA